jgi:dTDP-4-amino-4,6-dideoxygalactose transaminase
VPVSDRLADVVLSLPIHAYLETPVQDRIIDALRRNLDGSSS